MRTQLLALAAVLVGAALIVAGYRSGGVGGLFLMAVGGLGNWYVVRTTLWSIPSIGDVQDRAREDGLGVPHDTREWDPDIRQDRHVADYLDRRGRGRS